MTALGLNVGCGRDIKDGYVNMDWLDLPGVNVVHDATKLPYPFEAGSFTIVKAWDVIEHFPHFADDGRPMMIAWMAEVHRLLRPEGVVDLHFPNAAFPESVWVDPTHVRGFTEHSFDYWDPDTEFGRAYGFYTSGVQFKVLHEYTDVKANKQIRMVLEKR